MEKVMRYSEHDCGQIPVEVSITWSEMSKPHLTLDIGDEHIGISSDMEIDYCPWCGDDLQLIRHEWMQNDFKPF